MANQIRKLIVLLVILSIAIPFSATVKTAAAPAVPVTFTILHTNDFHGQLQEVLATPSTSSNPGMARVAKIVNDVRTTVGTDKVLLVDAGDEMQGSLLSNINKGEPTIAVYNAMGYNVATFGNHEFDWGQQTLIDRTTQAAFPYVSANIVAGACTGWTPPSFAVPYVVKTIGEAPNQVNVAFIGVTTTETPIITIASATQGLCFKDPAESILHYYDAMKVQADVIVVLSHLGYTDGGYGYGIPIYGDQTLATKLNTAGKPVNLIIGGHSHTNLSPATVVGTTTIAQAHYNGRKVGRADITVNPNGTVAVSWSRLTVYASNNPPVTPEDADIKALIATYTSDPAYQTLINQEIGWTNVPIARNYEGDSLMGYFVNDAIYNDLNTDAVLDNDVDIVFNNPGGLRADISCAAYPCQLTYGMMFNILPFGNQTVVGQMTGAQIMELLNQSALLSKGAIQVAGIRYKFYDYRVVTIPGPTPTYKTWAWGAFDACVIDKTDSSCDPLDMAKTYKIATNEFLAPAGQDNFLAFKYVTNISYYGDMLDGLNRWVNATYTEANPYNGVLDGRIFRDGNDTSGSIIPITILHHNDSHGNLAKGAFVGYTQLATLIKQERAYNPDRTLLLSSGDNIQGDAMMYYFKSAPLGHAADGTPLAPPLTTHPMMAVMNAMGYDAWTLGNHEFNFGSQIFTSVIGQATFPTLQANLVDDGQYGSGLLVDPYVEKIVGPEGIKVAILGIGNHRVPNYELPSNIPGLSFLNPLVTAQQYADQLRPGNDVVVALTHIGFTPNPSSVEVDNNVDTVMAAQTTGLDAIIGGHSHTDPSKQTAYSGVYKYLPTIVGGPANTPVLVTQAYRYNNYLGEVVIGLQVKAGGGYEVVSRVGQYILVTSSTTEDPAIKAIVDPYVAQLNTYNNTVVGKTTAPIDTMLAFTQETNGANLQADASVYELKTKNGIPVDFHLSGAMTNKLVATGATPASPVTLKVSDMFAAMPYENSLVVISMNGPQLKAVLERAYRNYYYYKYVPGYGGYSYYTTCMLDTNFGNQITYNDLYPALPNGSNVVSLTINGTDIDFTDALKFYNVSTVNYLAAGSCNFNDGGVTLWPLSQIVADTQFYVRDAVIDYTTFKGIVSPAIEGRLSFITDTVPPAITKTIGTPQFIGGASTYVTSVTTLTVNVSDGLSGVRSCSITVAGPGSTTNLPCVAGDNVFTLAGPDGAYTITVSAMDMAWNVSTFTETDILDNTPPAITINAPQAQAYLHPNSLTLDFNALDANAGVKMIQANLDIQSVTSGQVIDLYTLLLGSHTLTVYAKDNLGNGTSKSVTFSVTATIQSLMTSVNRFYSEGKITKADVYKGLMDKLNAAAKSTSAKEKSNILNAFISLVQVQKGKSIKVDAANLLITDAKWVIANLK